jgi:hypothetical protein
LLAGVGSSHLSLDAVCWLVSRRPFEIGTVATIRSKSIALQSFKDDVKAEVRSWWSAQTLGAARPPLDAAAGREGRSGDLGKPEYGV